MDEYQRGYADDLHCDHAPWSWDEQEDGEYDDYCVHCDCCCTCLGCEYGPRDGMLMFPRPVIDEEFPPLYPNDRIAT